MPSNSPSRKPLHERSDSDTNTRPGAIRIVPQTPPRLLGQRDDVYLRTPLPTHPSHILSPGKGKAKDVEPPALQLEFQPTTKTQSSTASSGSPVSTARSVPQSSQDGNSIPGTQILKPKPIPKKRLRVHKDNKTFSLVPQDDSHPEEDLPQSPKRPVLSAKSSYASLQAVRIEGLRSNSIDSCNPISASIGPGEPSTPAPDIKASTSDIISSSPWNYEFVGGLRKVQKTPDLKKTAPAKSESLLASLPELSDGQFSPTTHDLSTKPSFGSTETSTSTISESTNYKIYRDASASTYEAAVAPPSTSGSNYQLLGNPSPTSSVVFRPKSSPYENENYELHGEPSPSASYIHLPSHSKYSQESLVVPPLRPRARRSSENLGYYKSRSRESLRTGSLTSISTVLSQQEATHAIVGSGSLILVPNLNPKLKVTSSWAESLSTHMNEHPHQWSSQLSTVHSVSDGGTDRDSRSWSDDHGRRNSGFPSTPSRHSRHILSISSSQAQEDGASRSDSIEPPQPAFSRGQRHLSNSSIRMIEDQDEYGDGITDMQDLRARPSRTRLSGFFSVTSSDNGRTNTMRSTGSSRANSLLASTIPTWAKLYYGSGERRYLGAPGSSTEGTDSRSGSFLTGSPNTDHFPLSIYSPRRRPRENNARAERSGRDSLEITPALEIGDDTQGVNNPYSRRVRTWSMSSIWSPHLRRDRRATQQSIWEPPSVNWSAEGGWYGRRNVQIIMFITGFIFPLSWMIASLLPLPMNPVSEMQERDGSMSNLDSSNDISNDFARRFSSTDEARYESAKWWRSLNRWMSLVGLLIITAVVVLVVLSIKEGW